MTLLEILQEARVKKLPFKRKKWDGPEYFQDFYVEYFESIDRIYTNKTYADSKAKTSYDPSGEDLFATDWYLVERNPLVEYVCSGVSLNGEELYKKIVK